MALAGKAIRNEPVRRLRGGSSVNEVNDRLSAPRKRDSETPPTHELSVCRI